MVDGLGFKVVDADTDDDGGKRGPPMREKIVNAVMQAKVTFWSDPDGTAFATVPVGEHIERHRVRSRRFGLIVRTIYGMAHMTVNNHPGAVSDTSMAEALPQFEAMALQNRIGREVDVRVIREAGAIWLDLGDDDWTTIRVDADGWRILDKATVPLVRPNGLRALPKPVRSTTALADLRRLINVASEPDFILIVSWLVATLHPEGPFPVLSLDGEQGSAKSTAALMLRKLTDPNKAPHRAAPKTEADLLIAATNGRIVSLDNISHLDPDLADSICRVATGAGFSKRLLYSDGEEHIIYVCRPVLLNGIPSLLARGDLADRALAVTLPTIPDAARLPETEVWAAFDRAAPGILALLLDALAMAERDLPTLRLSNLPRMADFARLACAAAPAFGWTAETVLAAINGNRAAAVAAVIDADPVAGAVRDIVANGLNWEGTATELLAEVNLKAPIEVQRERGWPKDGARLSARLRRLAPALRRSGVEVVLPASGGRAGRKIKLRGEERQKQRSERSSVPEVYNPLETQDIPGTLTNIASVPERSSSVPEPESGTLSVPGTLPAFRSVPPNPLKTNGPERWNARNAASSSLTPPTDIPTVPQPGWEGAI